MARRATEKRRRAIGFERQMKAVTINMFLETYGHGVTRVELERCASPREILDLLITRGIKPRPPLPGEFPNFMVPSTMMSLVTKDQLEQLQEEVGRERGGRG